MPRATMQQQTVNMHDLKEVCEKSYAPCLRDSTVVYYPSVLFGRLEISRCAGLCNLCGELFVKQLVTGQEMPLHVLGRQDETLADLCWNAYRMALCQEGRGNDVLCTGGITPVVLDL
jgi:hypothetical protein